MEEERELQRLRKEIERLRRNQILQERIFDRQHALLSKLNQDYEQALGTIEKQNLELREAKRNADEVSRSKGEFLASMSHEIRTPLNVILGASEFMLTQGEGRLDKRRLRVIHDSANYLMGLLSNILDYSRLSAGKVSLEIVDFNIHEVLENILEGVRPRAEKKGLQLLLVISPNVPDWLRGDVYRLRQVIYNLLDNAVKFTSSGWVRLEFSIRRQRPDADTGASICEIAVSDTGLGVEASSRERIFETFGQADGSISRRFGGTGLGLSICAHLARLMGGDLNMRSRKGRGSTFSFSLPLAIGREPVMVPGADRKLSSLGRQPLNVLVVEDHAPNADIMSDTLERDGHTPRCARDAEQAISMLQEHKFDVVIMDVELPGQSGVQLVGKLRRGELAPAPANVPVIAVTAHTSRKIHDQCLDAGMNDVFVKPVNYGKLLARLQEHDIVVRQVRQTFSPQFRKRIANSLMESHQRLASLLHSMSDDSPGSKTRLDKEAHYLANSLGLVQSDDGVRLALGLEMAVKAGSLSRARDIWRELSPLVLNLRQELEAALAS